MFRVVWVMVTSVLALGCKRAPTDAGATVLPGAPAPAPYCGAEKCPCARGSVEARGAGAELCELSETTTIQGVRCAPGRVEFHPNGALASCDADGPIVTIEGHACRTSPMAWRVHANRRLALCQDFAPFQLGKIPLDGRVLELRDDGSLRTATFARELELQFGDYWCRNAVSLYRDGSVAECLFARAAERPGIPMPKDSRAMFRRDGTLVRLELAADAMIQGVMHHKDERICFDMIGEKVKLDSYNGQICSFSLDTIDTP